MELDTAVLVASSLGFSIAVAWNGAVASWVGAPGAHPPRHALAIAVIVTLLVVAIVALSRRIAPAAARRWSYHAGPALGPALGPAGVCEPFPVTMPPDAVRVRRGSRPAGA